MIHSIYWLLSFRTGQAEHFTSNFKLFGPMCIISSYQFIQML